MAAGPNKNTYKASICLGHVLDFECAKEPVRVIDELHKALEESACAPDFWKQAS
jgi:hypothetical protein